MKRKGYGIVEFVDKRKIKNDGWDDQIEPEYRKPTPAEREEMILNHIRVHNGKSLNMQLLAKLFNVTVRTIQTHLRNLENKQLITREPVFTETGKQKYNKYFYNGEDAPLEDTALTIEKLYDPDNPCGFRDWDWELYKFIPGYYDEKFSRRDIQFQGEIVRRLKAEQHKKKDKFYHKK